MNRITLNLAALAAIAPAMATKDVRYYLNGALAEREKSGRVTLVGCDGRSLIAARDDRMTWEGPEGVARVIIPRDLVLAILKAAKKTDEAATLDIGDADALVATVGAVTLAGFRAIDGRFPEWTAPLRAAIHAEPADMAAFDPDVIGVAMTAANAYRKRAGMRHAGVHFKPAGEAETAFTLRHLPAGATVAGVVMPLRQTSGETAHATDRAATLAEFLTAA